MKVMGSRILQASYPLVRRQSCKKDHPASLGVTCGQFLEFPNSCWFYRPSLSLHINSYPYSSRRWVRTEPIYWPKIPLPLGIE